MREGLAARNAVVGLALCGLTFLHAPVARSQGAASQKQGAPDGSSLETSQDMNHRLEQLRLSVSPPGSESVASDYRIGTDDVLELSVFGAPELNGKLRVSADGTISTPLTGEVQAAGLTARELQSSLETKLKAYMHEPHVGVFVSSVESHPVSVLGEVNKPGVFQIRQPKTLLEMLSMAQGLADDAGDKVIVMRSSQFRPAANSQKDPIEQSNSKSDATTSSPPGSEGKVDEADPSGTITIDLKLLLDSGNASYNVPVYPGDIVKVTKAGIVYVVGGVKKPGGFTMRSNEEMSLLKAIALAEGLSDTAAKSRTRIIHTDELSGRRFETPVDLGKILAGKSADVPLKAADIVFVPRSTGKSALFKGTETAVATASGVVIFHQY